MPGPAALGGPFEPAPTNPILTHRSTDLHPGTHRDDFDTTSLAPGWVSPRSRPDAAWSLTERPGWLTLHAAGTTLDRAGATIVAARQRHHDCRASVRVDPDGGTAGLTLRIDEPFGVRPAASDMIAFEVETADGHVLLAELDGRYLSTEVAGGFTGRVIGMYVTDGIAAFDWFDYRPVARPPG
ncbi:hypothetical protein [Micromonospora sp. NPDC049102]|uniref:beta-xylosidase family glycoside hydrolase n=1 Tax=Micromonospora sp. NPDC049102 TaxID=3364265 RepID=UPI00371C48A9